jgi:hypothetical protein
MSSPQNGNGPATSDEEHVGRKNSNIGAATVCEIGVLFGISNESNLNLDRSGVNASRGPMVDEQALIDNLARTDSRGSGSRRF